MVWLIETGVFPRTASRVIDSIEARGLSWMKYEEGQSESALPPDGACAIFWGSLGAAYDHQVAARWIPGAIGDAERFRCSVYHEHLGPVLANVDAVFTTAKAVVAEPSRVLGGIEHRDHVFVRPDSALKPFAGRRIATASLSLAALDHGFYYDDEQLPVVVSSAKQVGREWRFVIADGVVVAGCEYDVGRLGRDTHVPETARMIAARVAEDVWQAAPLYIVDVGEVSGVPRVMELNLFSGADFYDCDANAVVDAATRTAIRLHSQALAPR